MIEGWKYQTSRVALVPYDRAWPIFPDGLLGHLYLRTKQDGLLETAFCGQDPLDFDWFVGYLAKPPVILQIYSLQGNPLTPIGFCYLNGVSGKDGDRRSTFGFCFFKSHWATQEARDLVWLSLNYWMTELKIDVLHGITLGDNFYARNFARKFGFREVAEIPRFLYRQGGLTSAKVLMLVREDFEPLYAAWREKRGVAA